MLRPRLTATFVAIAIGAALAACGNDDDQGTTAATSDAGSTKEIAGAWTGQLQQAGIAPFRIAVTILPDGTGNVAYTGIRCLGEWTVQKSDPPDYGFEERITEGAGGKCKGLGTVTLVAGSDQLDYTFTGGGVTSRGVLTHGTPKDFNQVFEQAGAEEGKEGGA